MNSKSWKVIAIIFITLFVLETIAVGFLFYLGVSEINKENECAINVCSDADAYTYELGLCECYVNHEVTKQKYLT